MKLRADIVADTGVVQITDDDSTVEISISDIEVAETVGSAEVSITLSEAAANEVAVTAFTRAGSAVSGQDFFGKTELVTFAAGETTQVF